MFSGENKFGMFPKQFGMFPRKEKEILYKSIPGHANSLPDNSTKKSSLSILKKINDMIYMPLVSVRAILLLNY